MADVSTATSYMISDLPVKQAPSGTDIFLLEDAEGNAYQVPASALALSSEQVTAAINAWLAAHPEATTTVTDGSITMQKLAIDVTGAFQSLSDDIDDLETALGNKVPYPQTGGVNDYGTAGQVLRSKGDGTTVWGADGLSGEAKDAILDAFEHVAWTDDQGQAYIDAIREAFYPPTPATSITLNKSTLSFTTIGATQALVATVMPSDSTDTVTWSSSDTSVATVNNGVVTTVAYGTATITATAGSVSATCSVVVAQTTLVSISAVYTQSGTVYDNASLDSLKTDLVVTATYSDSTTSTVAANDYTLSGTLAEGTSTITVSYGGKTTTFTVTVTHYVRLPAEYQEVEWIGFDGNSRIVTNRTGSDVFKIEAKAGLTLATAEECIVSLSPGGTTAVEIGHSTTSGRVFFYIRNQSGSSTEVTGISDLYSYPVDIIADYSKNVKREISVTVNGNTYTGTTGSKATTFDSSDLFVVGGAYSGSKKFPYKGKIYSVKYYKDGVLDCELVPCYVKASNVIGLYDTTNSVFYDNDGAGTLTKGNDV